MTMKESIFRILNSIFSFCTFCGFEWFSKFTKCVHDYRSQIENSSWTCPWTVRTILLDNNGCYIPYFHKGCIFWSHLQWLSFIKIPEHSLNFWKEVSNHICHVCLSVSLSVCPSRLWTTRILGRRKLCSVKRTS